MKFKSFLFLGILLIATTVFAAGTVTESGPEKIKGLKGNYVLTLTCTADASDGSFPSTATRVINGFVYLVKTNPGTTAPTDNYDITLTDEDGVDIMNGELADRDSSDTECAVPEIDGLPATYPVDGTLTLAISNNSVNSAGVVVKIYYYVE